MKRWHALVLVWTLPSLVFLAITALVYSAYRIDPPDRLDEAERAAVIKPLREALEDREPTPCTVKRAGRAVAVTVWVTGRTMGRFDGYGANLAAAVDDAARQIRVHPQVRSLPPVLQSQTKLQVDVIVGRAKLGNEHWLGQYAIPFVTGMLPVNPGVDGIGAEHDGKKAMLLPHELVFSKVLSGQVKAETVDFSMGVDMKRIAVYISSKMGKQVPNSALFRFRTDTFVEAPDITKPPVQLTRGIPPPPPLSAQALRDAALQGGRYLVAHLSPSGRYIYEHDLTSGQRTDPRSGAYSMPRHAGTTYFLSELYRITKEPWLREPIERAFAHLAELLSSGRCASTTPSGEPFDCVLDRTETVAHLGSTALTVVALAEYQRATGDTRYLPLATKFATFLLYMQRPDGSFRHLYDSRKKQPDDKAELLYYSGESALALARMYTITGDEKYGKASERALDWLVGWYDFFLGGFFYGEEHWTCIAAEAIWPYAKKDKYREFCDGYGAFLRQQQPHVGDHPDEDDLAGAYNFTPFVPPYNTPAGSRTETMISAYLLGQHHGHGDPEIRDQIRLTLQYALGQQIRPESMFDVVGEGLGGMPGSPIDRNVRIDYVQHVCSAMIRASEWIDQPPK
jgi:hypothetical protein